MFENNKRGQEGVTLTTLILIVIGVVVAIVIILFFTGVFDQIGGATDQLPGNLAAAAQACAISAQANSVTDFCYNFRELSDTQYSNCADPRITEELEANGVDVLTCDENNNTLQAKKNVCGDVSESDKNDTYFNNNPDDNCGKSEYSSASSGTSGDSGAETQESS